MVYIALPRLASHDVCQVHACNRKTFKKKELKKFKFRTYTPHNAILRLRGQRLRSPWPHEAHAENAP